MKRYKFDPKTREVLDVRAELPVIKILTSREEFVSFLLEVLNNNTHYGDTSRQGEFPSK